MGGLQAWGWGPSLTPPSPQVLEDVLSSQDTDTMASLLEVLVILWRSIRKSLELNQEAAQYTTCKFAQVLPEYFRVFQVRWSADPLDSHMGGSGSLFSTSGSRTL